MKNNNSKILEEGLLELNLSMTDQQAAQFQYFAEELISWNSKFNLTAINTMKDIYTLHFLDSISAIPFSNTIISSNFSICDIGTGAGFPGIPIKILYPDTQLTLVESSKKKCTFLQHITTELQLTNVEIISERIEEIGQNALYRESFDLVTARAVSKISTLLEYGIPLIKLNGILLDYSKEDLIRNHENLNQISHLLGGSSLYIHKINSSFLDNDKVVIKIQKLSSTENRYPRKNGIPSKRPL